MPGRQGDETRDPYHHDNRNYNANVSHSGSLAKIDNVTLDRSQRASDQNSYRDGSLPRQYPQSHRSTSQYDLSDQRPNVSYDSRTSDQSVQNPHLSRHESQRSVNHPDSNSQPLQMFGPGVSRHESQRSVNHPEQYHQSLQSIHASQSRLPTESPYMSRHHDESRSSTLQRQFSPPSERRNEQFQSSSNINRELSPPSRQPPSPRDRMPRHQGAHQESPYVSRHQSQRSIGQPSDFPHQSNVSRHESQRSLASQSHPSNEIHRYDDQHTSASSTLTRQPHYNQGQGHMDSAPSATSTLLRQSRQHVPQMDEGAPSAASTLRRDQLSNEQNRSLGYGSETSVTQVPIYTRQDSEPPPPYQTHSRQPSQGHDRYADRVDDTMHRDQNYPEQSMPENQNRDYNQSHLSQSQSQASHHRDHRMTPKLSRNESERSVARTQQSGYSQNSRADRKSVV